MSEQMDMETESKTTCPFTGKAYDCKNCEGHKEDWLGKGRHSIHCGHSVDGPLMRNSKKDWRDMAKYIRRDDGTRMTGEEIQIAFMKMHKEGKETFPIGTCDRFCFKHGCQGHAVSEVDA